MTTSFNHVSRRQLLKIGALAGAGSMLVFPALDAASQTRPLITRPIPSTGELLP